MNLCQENIHHVPENQKFAFREVGVPVWYTLGLFSLGEDVGGKTADFFWGGRDRVKKENKKIPSYHLHILATNTPTFGLGFCLDRHDSLSWLLICKHRTG